MKIAIDSGSALTRGKTGISWYTWNLIHNLAKIDKRNLYILYDISSRIRKTYKIFDSTLPCQKNFRKKVYPFHSSLVRKLMPVTFLTSKTDILHMPEQRLSPVFNTKKIVTVHDIIPWLEIYTDVKWMKIDSQKRRTQRKHIQQSVLKSYKIIAVSEHTKNDIVKYFSVNPSKISVTYLGVNEIFYPRGKDESILHKYKISKKFIACSAAACPRKNIRKLLIGFEKIKKTHNCQLVIFGRISNKSSWCEVYNNLPSNIKQDIVFTGYVSSDDLSCLYSGAEFFIYPSLYEGFGLPPLEAMACGCPVITSNISSMPEVVDDAGILIDPYNLDEMTEQMERLLLDEGLREKLKVKGLERAKQFTWEKTARETLKVYEEVYNEK